VSTGNVARVVPWVGLALAVSVFIVPALSPFLIPTTAVVAWWACSVVLSQTRAWGLRRSAVPTIWLVGVVWFLAAVGPDLVSYPSPLWEIDLVLQVVPAIGLVVGVFAPRQIVRLTGGPSTEWQEFWERAAITDASANGNEDATPTP
jgi:hypothetical protein